MTSIMSRFLGGAKTATLRKGGLFLRENWACRKCHIYYVSFTRTGTIRSFWARLRKQERLGENKQIHSKPVFFFGDVIFFCVSDA